VTLEEAQAGVDVISARLQEAYPQTNADKALRLTGLRDVLTEDYRLSLWVLTGAVALVLLIACGNAAGILLARAPARRFELCIRGAMGAPRGRLVRQLLGESLILALGGGALGTVLALWFQRVMLEYLAMDRLGLEASGVSWPVLAAALAISVLAGVMAGAVPAFRGAGTSVSDGLKTGNRGKDDGGSAFRSGLVVAQVALSVILLAGSGLLVKSLLNLRELDPGFESRDLVTAEVQLPPGTYPWGPTRVQFFSRLRNALQAVPGVESVALTSHLPIGDFGNIYRAISQGREEEPERVFLRSVFPGYFETLGIPVLMGRDLEDADNGEDRNVVVLSRTAAERLFPDGAQPLGKEVALNMASGPLWMEVVGVVGDVRLSRLEEAPEAALYVPYPQRPRNAVSLALKTRVPPEALAGTLRETVRQMDSSIPVFRIATLESLVSESLAERRIVTLSLTLLALLPLALAAVGLFAVLAYHVARRRHEMGVRLALGAPAIRVGGIVLRQGMTLVGVGALLGMAGAWAATRLLQSLLFGVQATDPWTFTAVTGLVLGTALLAASVPVWRAVRSDPRVVLEAE
jgi:putative ABC transport system permease protein